MLFNYAPQNEDIIILSGGEPSIYPKLRPLLEAIRAHSACKVVMYSNGSGLCSADTADAIARYVDRVTLSCYGDSAVHDWYAGRKGAFATLKKAADSLCKARKGLKRASILELKYVRATENISVLPLLNELAQPDQVGSVVLSRMLSDENETSARVGVDDAVVCDITSLQADRRWDKVPLKLVDVLPCSLGLDIFDEIRADHPHRAVQEVVFFDGAHPQGNPICFARQASFSPQCVSCDLQTICGTTATCYGALCRAQGRWCYAEE
jgi:organic radical activating enzyme